MRGNISENQLISQYSGLTLSRFFPVEIKLNHYRPQAQKGRVPATLSAEHRMDDAPAGVEDRQADRCVYDHFEPERKIFHGILHRMRELLVP